MTTQDHGPDTMRSQGVAGVTAAMRKMPQRQAFTRPGPMAILSSAYGQEFDLLAPQPVKLPEPQIAVVDIHGPLVHHDECSMCMFGCFDSYESIIARVGQALQTTASTVILRIDSPGGEAAGVHETARKLQAMAAAAGKQLVAYVDELCASAAYALACACSEIWMPESGTVGAIGVIERLVDCTKADTIAGVEFKFVVSGQRKADAHPHAPVTPEVVAAVQTRVDALAVQFFGLVAEARDLTPQQVEAYQANLFQGPNAAAVKLANGVCSFDELIGRLVGNVGTPQRTNAPAANAPEGAKGSVAMAIGKKEIVALLKHEAAKDPKKQMTAEEVVKMVEAMTGEAPAEPGDKDDDKEPPSSAPGKDEDEDEEEEKKDEEEEEEEEKAAKPKACREEEEEKAAARASAAASDPMLALAAEVQALKAERAAEKEAAERSKLLASRPDFDRSVLAALNGKPIEYVRFAVETFPKVPSAPAAAASARGTRGETQVSKGESSVTQLRPNEEMDRAMGLATPQARVHRDGCDVVFPALTAEQARSRLAEMAKGAAK